ncbi:helix-turn-helix transcriptional regulator [Pseudoduganella ginsengisoli]|nr:helix-turn-helix transcriptional regulator [Pseudoduganella ginsengisoli]
MCATSESPLLPVNAANRLDGPPVIAVLAQGAPRDTAMHRHARGQVLASMNGLLVVETEAGRLSVPPGCAAWLPPKCRHGMRAHGPFHGWSAYIVPGAGLPGEACVMQVPELLRAAALRAASWQLDGAWTAAQQHIAAVIIDELSNAPSQAWTLPLPHERRMLKLARHVADHPGDVRRMPELAAWAGIAPRTLTRRFAAETGMAFAAWRRRACVLRAMALLAEELPVTAIALELGYDSLSAFIAMFRRETGVTPSQYAMARQR